jgi:hypothetical protein
VVEIEHGETIMEQHSPSPQRLQGQRELVDGKILALCQWQAADIAMNVARRYFEAWLHSNHKDTPAMARLHAYHTHEALHEATRAIGMLIETLRAQAPKSPSKTESDTDV